MRGIHTVSDILYYAELTLNGVKVCDQVCQDSVTLGISIRRIKPQDPLTYASPHASNRHSGDVGVEKHATNLPQKRLTTRHTRLRTQIKLPQCGLGEYEAC